MKSKLTIVSLSLLSVLAFADMILAEETVSHRLSAFELGQIIGGFDCPCAKKNTGSMCVPPAGEPISCVGQSRTTPCRDVIQAPAKNDECGTNAPDTSSTCDLDPSGDVCLKFQNGNCVSILLEQGEVYWCEVSDPQIHASGLRTVSSGAPCP